MEIPEIRINQDWQGKDLTICASIERLNRPTQFQGVKIQQKDLTSEAEIAFQLSKIFMRLYEDLVKDNAERAKTADALKTKIKENIKKNNQQILDSL